nr:uncharacterized protein LOC109167352 [Ipomoea batatas]
MDGLAQELQDLKDKVEGKIRPSARALLTSSPFTPEIMAYKVSIEIKLPEHPTYDGTGDSCEHLVNYQAKMQILGAEEPLMCTAFLSTLKGLAQKWFLALLDQSIKCFNDLADQFLTHYTVNIKPQRNLPYEQCPSR